MVRTSFKMEDDTGALCAIQSNKILALKIEILLVLFGKGLLLQKSTRLWKGACLKSSEKQFSIQWGGKKKQKSFIYFFPAFFLPFLHCESSREFPEINEENPSITIPLERKKDCRSFCSFFQYFVITYHWNLEKILQGSKLCKISDVFKMHAPFFM